MAKSKWKLSDALAKRIMRRFTNARSINIGQNLDSCPLQDLDEAIDAENFKEHDARSKMLRWMIDEEQYRFYACAIACELSRRLQREQEKVAKAKSAFKALMED